MGDDMKKPLKIFVAELNGRGVIAFACPSEARAKSVAGETSFRLKLKGQMPEWDGKSFILRHALPREARTWRRAATVWSKSSYCWGPRVLEELVYLQPGEDAVDVGKEEQLAPDVRIDNKFEPGRTTERESDDVGDQDREYITFWERRNRALVLAETAGAHHWSFVQHDPTVSISGVYDVWRSERGEVVLVEVRLDDEDRPLGFPEDLLGIHKLGSMTLWPQPDSASFIWGRVERSDQSPLERPGQAAAGCDESTGLREALKLVKALEAKHKGGLHGAQLSIAFQLVISAINDRIAQERA